MKTIAFFLLAAASAVAQIRPVGVKQPEPVADAAKPAPAPAPPVAGSIPSGKPLVSAQALNGLEGGFDQELGSYGYPSEPMDIVGRTRGIYLSDYGVVFTTQLSLIITPPITPFHQNISEQEKARTHQRKLERLPALKKLMSQMLKTTATQLATLPDNQQVVVMVTLLYLPYENTQGLPQQVLMKGDKRSILAGRFTTVEE